METEAYRIGLCTGTTIPREVVQVLEENGNWLCLHNNEEGTNDEEEIRKDAEKVALFKQAISK